jgi:hypothetical protein
MLEIMQEIERYNMVKNEWGDEWPLEEMVQDVGPGWGSLIKELYEICDRKGIAVVQVKEKFGGLRFYTENEDDELSNAIRKAEDESYTICEQCGAPGKPESLSKGGWIKTRCINCK